MKLMAVVPPVPIDLPADIRPPMRLAYIASVLRHHDIDVDILDAHALQLSEEHVIDEVAKQHPDVVLFDLYDFYPIQDFSSLVRRVKQHIGCLVASNWPIQTPLDRGAADILRKTDLDIIIVGEPELTVLEMGQRLKKNRDLTSVRGIAFKDHDRIIPNPVRPLITDLDSLPFPARDLLPNHKYRMTLMKKRPFAFIIGSRGCPYHCIFCNIPLTQGHRYRCRSPSSIADELEWIIERNGIREVHFEDPIFTLDPTRCIRICDEIMERHIDLPWTCHSRVDTVNKATLQALKQAGCYQIQYGVESGDTTVLQNIQKGIQIHQVKKAFRLAKACGLETHAFFMIGNYGETKHSIEKTLSLCHELQPDFASFPVTIPLFGTPLYDSMMKGHDAVSKLTYEDLQDTSWRAYRDFYGSRRFVINTLLKVIKHPSRVQSLIEQYRGYVRLQRTRSWYRYSTRAHRASY
jgi:anaerobic magnesium-protoporphyrin IX monomethyl ester cyclase